MSWRCVVTLLLVAGLSGACSKKDKKEPAAKPPRNVPAAEAAALPAAAELPADVMGFFVCGNPAGLLSGFETLGSKVNPVPPGTLHAMVNARLHVAGLKDTRVVDLEAPAGVVLLDPKKYEPPVVIALHTQGQKKLLEALRPTYQPKKGEGPIVELVRAGAEEQGSVFVLFEDKLLFVAPSREALQAGSGVLASRLKKSLPAAGLAGAVRVDRLRAVYREELAGLPGLLGQAMERDQALATGGDLERMRWLMEWMVKKMVALVQQTRGVQLALAVDEQTAVARIGIVPEKESFFHKMLQAQKKAPLQLVEALPADHFLAMGFNLQWEPFQDELVAFSREIMQVMFDMELTEEYLGLMKRMWQVMGDEMAISENLSEKGLVVYELMSVDDEDEARAVFDQLMSLTPKLIDQAGGGVAGMKISYEGPHELGEHEGVSLRAIDVVFDTKDMPAAQAAALKALYGGARMRMAYALFDKRFGMVLGKDAKQGLQDLIDRVRGKAAGKGMTASKAFQAAAGGLDRDAGGYAFMSLSGMVEAGLRSTYAAMGRTPPPSGKPHSGMFVTFSSTPERMTTTLRLPADHLEELGQTIKAMMQGPTRP